MIRYGKPIKNKKRSDPRYFLNEWDSRPIDMDIDEFAHQVHTILWKAGYHTDTAKGESLKAGGRKIHSADAFGLVAEKLGVDTEQIANLWSGYTSKLSDPEYADYKGVLWDGTSLSAIGSESDSPEV